MKKFVFSLSPLLKYREFIEDKAKLEVAKAATKFNKCKNNIENAKKNLEKTMTDLNNAIVSGIEPDLYQRYKSYYKYLNIYIKSETLLLKDLNAILLKKQKHLKIKAVEKKIIAQYKEKQKKKYYENLLKIEQKEADEIILIRQNRKPAKNEI